MMTETDERNVRQADFLENRLKKRYRHLKKWAARSGISSYRLYDRDIPEIPLAIDLYTAEPENIVYLHVFLFERPYEKDEQEEEKWLSAMLDRASAVLPVPRERIFVKVRKKQRGTAQYEKTDGVRKLPGNGVFATRENGLLFRVNLAEYLDTGLFLDHRPARLLIRSLCSGKDVLNLFCYTGSFSVYAAAAGASSVDSVDLSNTYLEWARSNFALNGLDTEMTDGRTGMKIYRFIREDASAFLDSALRAGQNGKNTPGRPHTVHTAVRSRWDIIILDPPTFSNSKRTENSLDINRDWATLANKCMALLKPRGSLFFSTNSGTLKFSPAYIYGEYPVTDMTDMSIDEDFKNRKPHRMWRIDR